MILNRAIANKCIFTLSEKTTILNANYLFEIICTQDNTNFYFITPDLSTNKLRYNEFDFDVTLFTLNGSYKVNVYEQVSNSNLNPTGLKLIDTDRIKVIGEQVVNPSFTTTEIINIFND